MFVGDMQRLEEKKIMTISFMENIKLSWNTFSIQVPIYAKLNKVC